MGPPVSLIAPLLGKSAAKMHSSLGVYSHSVTMHPPFMADLVPMYTPFMAVFAPSSTSLHTHSLRRNDVTF